MSLVRLAPIVLLLLALGAPPAHAKAPTKSEIDDAVARLPAEAVVSVEDAKTALAGAQGNLEAAKTDVAAAKLRQEAARLQVSRAESDLKAIDKEIAASELLSASADRESLAVRRARAESALAWRQAEVDARRFEIQALNQRVTRAKARVAHREAELHREKLEAWSNNGGSPDVGTAAGKAFKAAANKRRAWGKADRNVKKAEKKWQKASKAAARMAPEDTSEALVAAHERALADKDEEVAAAKAEAEGAEEARRALQKQLTAAAGGDSERIAELEAKNAALAEESDARVAEVRKQLDAERAAYSKELDALRAQMAEDAGGEAAKELAAVQADLEGVRAKEAALAAELATAKAERDAALREAAGLRVQLEGSEEQQAMAIKALEDELVEASRDADTAVSDAEAAREAAVAAQEREAARRAEVEAELAAAEEKLASADGRDDLLALVASLKRQLSALKANSEDQVDLLERKLGSMERKHDRRVEELAAALEAARSEGDDLALEAQRAVRDRNEMLRELEKVKSQRDAQGEIVRLTEEQLADVQAQVDRADQAEVERDRLKDELADAQSGATKAAEEAVNQITALTTELTTAKDAQAELEAELEMLRGQLAASEERRDREISEAVTAAKAEASTDETLRAEVEIALASAEARAAELEGELDALRLRHQALERDLAELESERDAAAEATAAVEEDLASLERKLQDSKGAADEQIAWLRAELAGARSNLTEQADKLSDLENSLADKERTIARLKAGSAP